MYCKYCGELLDDDAAFCTKCGNSLKKGQVSEHPDTSNNECETEQEIETNENSLNNIIDTPNDLNTPEDVNAEGKKTSFMGCGGFLMLIVAIIVGGLLFLKGCGANLTSALHDANGLPYAIEFDEVYPHFFVAKNYKEYPIQCGIDLLNSLYGGDLEEPTMCKRMELISHEVKESEYKRGVYNDTINFKRYYDDPDGCWSYCVSYNERFSGTGESNLWFRSAHEEYPDEHYSTVNLDCSGIQDTYWYCEHLGDDSDIQLYIHIENMVVTKTSVGMYDTARCVVDNGKVGSVIICQDDNYQEYDFTLQNNYFELFPSVYVGLSFFGVVDGYSGYLNAGQEGVFSFNQHDVYSDDPFSDDPIYNRYFVLITKEEFESIRQKATCYTSSTELSTEDNSTVQDIEENDEGTSEPSSIVGENPTNDPISVDTSICGIYEYQDYYWDDVTEEMEIGGYGRIEIYTQGNELYAYMYYMEDPMASNSYDEERRQKISPTGNKGEYITADNEVILTISGDTVSLEYNNASGWMDYYEYEKYEY